MPRRWLDWWSWPWHRFCDFVEPATSSASNSSGALVAALSVASVLVGLGLSRVLPAAEILAGIGMLGAVVGIPVAIAVAILRHRLYDIDRLINRSMVYGLLTALFGAVYVGSVFGLGQLLNPARGESELAVAASTLAVAALFQPARRRVQAAVDRRCNDASTTPPRPSRNSAAACATRSTWTHCRRSC